MSGCSTTETTVDAEKLRAELASCDLRELRVALAELARSDPERASGWLPEAVDAGSASGLSLKRRSPADRAGNLWVLVVHGVPPVRATGKWLRATPICPDGVHGCRKAGRDL